MTTAVVEIVSDTLTQDEAIRLLLAGARDTLQQADPDAFIYIVETYGG